MTTILFCYLVKRNFTISCIFTYRKNKITVIYLHVSSFEFNRVLHLNTKQLFSQWIALYKSAVNNNSHKSLQVKYQAKDLCYLNHSLQLVQPCPDSHRWGTFSCCSTWASQNWQHLGILSKAPTHTYVAWPPASSRAKITYILIYIARQGQTTRKEWLSSKKLWLGRFYEIGPALKAEHCICKIAFIYTHV